MEILVLGDSYMTHTLVTFVCTCGFRILPTGHESNQGHALDHMESLA